MKPRAFTTLGLVTLGWGALALSLPSCSKNPSWSNGEWHSEADGPPPHPPSLGENKMQGQLGETQVELTGQSIEGVPIEGSFLKTLGKHGHITWAKAKYLEEKNLPDPGSVRQELKRRDAVVKRMDRLGKIMHCKLAGEANPELRWQNSWRLVYKETCEKPGGELLELVISSRGKLISRTSVGAGMAMAETPANIFPKGPKLSDLKVITIEVATRPDYLVSPAVEVVSDAGLKFVDLAQLQATSPSDDRFDMLEAYYFSTRALDWVAQHLKFQWSGLKIRTHVGFPQKSNVAFYYGREVRLGTGDDISFSHMAWDPTIVIHETMHGIVEALTRLPLGSGEGGSLQEALADSLTALQLDTPDMGEASYKIAPFQRTLDNNIKLSDKTGGLYHDSLILSGTVWELRVKLGEPTAEDLVAYLLGHLVPSSGFTEVQKEVKEWLATLPDKKAAIAGPILQQRGWL